MKTTIHLLCILLSVQLLGNNVQISNVTLTDQNTILGFYMVEFDISWENSWRTSTYESNWDAAWVFVKFTPKNQQAWAHANLHYVDGTNDGHQEPSGCTIRTANNSYGDLTLGRGVFIYRRNAGIGDINFQKIQLRWDYPTNGVGNNDIVEISVHAIEMVYVPAGNFQVGDGKGDFGQLEAGNTGNPFTISSENALTLGGTNVNNLSNNDAVNMLSADDFNYITTQALPAAFPKGFDAFYCMKYEASQAQYAAFLEHLTSTQRAARLEVINVNSIDVYPIEVGNYWATADNPARAMDYANWLDMATYLDWAGLRPMSELEYEKASRGTQTPISGEYAWGNASWYLEEYFTLENEGTAEEIIIGGINENVGNGNSVSIYQGYPRPLRCGIFAASAVNKTREETGASYYGIMELTGNCYERVVSIGNSQSRDFTGLHGDGLITGSGNASTNLLADWGYASAIGVGFKNAEISQRYQINDTDALREKLYGIRGVRSAQ